MEIKPIKSEKDYDNALKRMEEIFNATPNTKEGDEAEVLSILIEDYESKNHPIERIVDGSVSLRDYFAAKAIQGLVSRFGFTCIDQADFHSEKSYLIADAMLKARKL